VGGDLGHAIGHAGAAGDAVDQAFGPFQNAGQHLFGAAHFPQHVHVQAAFAAGDVVGDAGLGDTAPDAVVDQFDMAFAPGLALIDDRHEFAGFIVKVGIHP